MSVDCLESMYQTCTEKLSLMRVEFSLPSKMKSEITSKQKIHYQIQILGVLESIVRIDDEFGVYD